MTSQPQYQHQHQHHPYQPEYQLLQNYLNESINSNRFNQIPQNIKTNLLNVDFQNNYSNLLNLLQITRNQLNNYKPNREIPTNQIALFTILKLLIVLNGFEDIFSLDEVLIIGGSQLIKVERDLIDRLFERERRKQRGALTKDEGKEPRKEIDTADGEKQVGSETVGSETISGSKTINGPAYSQKPTSYGLFDTQLTDKPNITHPVTPITLRDIDLLVSFQAEIDKSQPNALFLPGLINDWPAIEKWKSLDYWMDVTIQGKRSVPIEIGRTYLSTDWKQQIMPFKQFIDQYLQNSTNQCGYMAQHDLIHHITELNNDVLVPDICHVDTSRHKYPRPQAVALYVNTWIGPKHSISPLHHDPYFNLYCQVVGYKYIRLYPPQTANMYPRENETNDKGQSIDMSNTSNVDLSRPDKDKYPEFPWNDHYKEIIIGPGDCLFIPRGWWHYVESLTQSVSLSLWF